MENCPHNPGTGTITVVNGIATGTGTAFTSEFAGLDGGGLGIDDPSGCLIFIEGQPEPYVINVLSSNTALILTDRTVNCSGKRVYRGVNLSTTIAAYVSATAATLTAGSSLAVTGLEACFGTDDSAALASAHVAAVSQLRDVAYPSGIYCVTANLGFTSASRIAVRGAGIAQP